MYIYKRKKTQFNVTMIFERLLGWVVVGLVLGVCGCVFVFTKKTTHPHALTPIHHTPTLYPIFSNSLIFISLNNTVSTFLFYSFFNIILNSSYRSRLKNIFHSKSNTSNSSTISFNINHRIYLGTKPVMEAYLTVTLFFMSFFYGFCYRDFIMSQ
jgi:hypothetical protein